MVLADVVQELEEGIRYVLTLPYSATGYRMASLLCLLPAYQTILLAAQRQSELFTADHQVKISRQMLTQCIQDAHSIVNDNEAIQRYGRQIKQAIDSSSVAAGGDRITLPGLKSYSTYTQI